MRFFFMGVSFCLSVDTAKLEMRSNPDNPDNPGTGAEALLAPLLRTGFDVGGSTYSPGKPGQKVRAKRAPSNLSRSATSSPPSSATPFSNRRPEIDAGQRPRILAVPGPDRVFLYGFDVAILLFRCNFPDPTVYRHVIRHLHAHRDGDLVTIVLHDPHHEVTLAVDLAEPRHPLRAVTSLLVEHGFVSADLVRRTARSAALGTPYLELQPDERALIDVFAEIKWCRVERGETRREPTTDA